jgi:hypothetical protein
MIKLSFATPLEVPANDEEHWAYVLFQSYNTRQRVVGARIVDKPDFTGSTAYVTPADILTFCRSMWFGQH